MERVLTTKANYLTEQLGYDVSIIEDCCASREGHDHKIAIERLRDEGCRITTSRAAIMELVSAVNHPAAESIARLLK